MKPVSQDILTRVYVLFALFVLFSAAILIRVVALQLNKDQWVKREIEDKVFFQRVVADRGNILAEDGTIMAASLPFYRIALDPSVIDSTLIPNFNDSLLTLSALLANRFDEEEPDTLKYYFRIREAMMTGDRHVYLTRTLLSQKDLTEVSKWPILNLGRFGGGFIAEKIHNKRHYPFGDLARITLGVMQGDTLGIRGVEASYNRELRGEDGFILAQKIRGNAYIPLDQYGQEASEDGFDVITTLDVDLQDIVESELKKGVDLHQARHGTAILVEVETGKIKALANYPENYNYGIAWQLEPGSTFKLISAVAALEDSILDVCDTVDTGTGRVMFDDKEITDGARYGKLTFEQVFYKSSNVGVSSVIYEGFKDKPEEYLKYLDRFGLNEVANNQLEGEPAPVYYRPGDSDWTIATLPSMSIGYSVLVTPLQMAMAYNVIANEGKLLRPWLVKEIRNDSKIIRQYGPEVINEAVCGNETVRKVREMMLEVTDHGTAYNLRGTPFMIAGKTGTARKTSNGRYVKKYVASFGGFFPADRPRYTLYVAVNDPSSGEYYGNQVAAPIFKGIAERIYNFDWNMARPKEKQHTRPTRRPAPRAIFAENALEVYQSLGIETSLVPIVDQETEEVARWVRAHDNGHQVNFKSMPISENRVPNVRGMSARDAMILLERMGVSVQLRGYGKVRRQSLLPGYRIGNNTAIVLFLG